MAAHLVANFQLTHPRGYTSHVHSVLPMREAHGAEILVADYESVALEGQPGSVTVVIRFASSKALAAWYESPEYQRIVHLRTDNSRGMVIAAKAFDLQTNLRIVDGFARDVGKIA